MANENDEELVGIEVGSEEEVEQRQEPVVTKKEAKKEDNKQSEDDHDDDDHDDDEGERRVGHQEGEHDEDDEERRKKRREDKKKRRALVKKRRDENLAELSELRIANRQLLNRVNVLESRTGDNEIATLNSRLATVDSSIADAKEIIVKAREAGNHADSLEAEQIRDQLLQERGQLVNAINSRRAPPRQQQQLDPVVQSLAQEWLADKPWANSEKETIAVVDKQLVAEGFNPRTMRFWNEMDKRLSAKIPDRYSIVEDLGDDNDDDDERGDTRNNGGKKNGGPAMAGSGNSTVQRRLRPNEVLITPERKKAMIEAGAWDDPVKKKRMLKSFRAWDQNNVRSAAR